MPLLPIQEALAHAVAEEMQKVYRNELGPEPVPLTVPGETVDEEEVSVFYSFTYHLPGISCASSLALHVKSSTTRHYKIVPVCFKYFQCWPRL